MKSTKKDMALKVNFNVRLKFLALWEKIETMFDLATAHAVCEMTGGDENLILQFYTMSEESLRENISLLIIRQESQGDPKHSSVKSVEKSEEMMDEKEERKSKQAIKGKLIENEHKISKSPNHLEKQAEKMDEEPIGLIYYTEKMNENLAKYQRFNNLISKKEIDQFAQFYLTYEETKLLNEREIRSKAKSASNNFLEEIRLVDSALYLTTSKHRLYITQILAIFCFLHRKGKAGHLLLQILTGEGKSTTVACLAAILALRGRDVDIITTSQILAKRDVQEKSTFFHLLGVEVADNFQLQNDPKDQQRLKPKKCYTKNNVVYGTAYSYQVDLLYDEYKMKGTRNKRAYDVVIIDEVDSMFVDEKQNQTLLSTTYVGFSNLILPMRIIWREIVMHNIEVMDGKLYLYRQGKRQGEIVKGEANEIMKIIIKEIKEKFVNEVIPDERMEYIDISLQNWIWSALQAAHFYKENKNYIIRNGNIMPVDYKNTGSLQKNVEWEHGLHQFLQMKHGLETTTEGMTSNFMSNIGHFSRYSQIYGLTGTLGSEISLEFLKQTYEVNLMQIPPFHERRLKIDPGFLMYSAEEWIQKISERVTQLVEENRSVLCICQSIHHVESIEKHISGLVKPKVLKTGQQNLSDKVNCKEVIIATNIAGRGLDLKASEDLVSKGGLHVIITFMPENWRVEMQGRGRAGRNGAPGSSQLIVNYTEYSNEINSPLILKADFYQKKLQQKISLFCKNVRDKRQEQLMANDKIKVQTLRTKDKVFAMYCKAVNTIPEFHENKAKRDSIEETWALFLKKIEVLKLTNDEILNNAQNLIQRFVSNSDDFYNQSHQVGQGFYNLGKNNVKEARAHFIKAQNEKATYMSQLTGKMFDGVLTINQNSQKKESIEQGLKKISQIFPIIEKRKDVIKAIHSTSQTVENQNVVDFMNQQKDRDRKKLSEKVQKQSQKKMEMEEEQFGSEENNPRLNQREVQNLMDISEINVLNTIGDHMKKEMEKFQHLGKDQYIEFKYKSLGQIIDMTPGKEKQVEAAIEKISPQVPLIPVGEVKKKKKVPWWKRALVFALGVLQICVGAMILASSGGAAASFGTHMITSGITDCMNALFKPQLLEDLGKYFTKKAIQYTIALVAIGTEGINELAQMGKKGFTLFKNSKMTDLMKIAKESIAAGLKKAPFDFEGIVKQKLFEGLSEKLVDKSSEKVLEGQNADITKVVKKPEFKEMVSNDIKQEEQLEIKGKQIQEKFEKDTSKEIKKIIAEKYPLFLKQISSLNLDEQITRDIIDYAFSQIFEKKFNEENRGKNYEEMLYFITKNYNSGTLAADLIKKVKIKELITDTIRSISQIPDYEKIMENSKISLYNEIIGKVKVVSAKNTKEIDKQKNELQALADMINNKPMTPDQRNGKIQQFEAMQKRVKEKAAYHNSLQNEIRQFQQKGGLVENMIRMGVIKNGRINRNLQGIRMHNHLKEAILLVQDFETGQKQFEKYMQIKAYNSYIGISVKALTEVLANCGNSAQNIKEFQTKLYQNLLGI